MAERTATSADSCKPVSAAMSKKAAGSLNPAPACHALSCHHTERCAATLCDARHFSGYHSLLIRSLRPASASPSTPRRAFSYFSAAAPYCRAVCRRFPSAFSCCAAASGVPAGAWPGNEPPPPCRVQGVHQQFRLAASRYNSRRAAGNIGHDQQLIFRAHRHGRHRIWAEACCRLCHPHLRAGHRSQRGSASKETVFVGAHIANFMRGVCRSIHGRC